MEVIDKGIVIQDRDGKCIYGNSAAMRILGVGTGESLADALDLGRWKFLQENGHEMPLAQHPAARALSSGRIVESTVLGLFHLQRRQLIWITITVVPQYAPGEDTPASCFRCSVMSPNSSATAHCSTGRRRWLASAAGNGTGLRTRCT